MKRYEAEEFLGKLLTGDLRREKIQRKNLDEIRQIDAVLTELKKLSWQIHRLDEADCNYGLTDRQEKREEKLVEKANELAHKLGYNIYHQGDPRGCSLYLVDETMGESDYSQGLAIC